MRKGRKKVVSKQYFSDSDRFAAICNQGLFNGEAILHAEGLREADSEEQMAIGIDSDETQVWWKERDVLKVYQNEAVFMLIGIENQTDIHYCMPLRNLMYDALNYESQRKEIWKKHKRNKDLADAEYISGFAKTDRLLPVFTLVLYYGEEEWDGAKSLMELLDIPKELLQFKDKLMDYKINILDIRRIQNPEKCDDCLKAFLGFMKYQNDKNALDGYINTNAEVFCKLSIEDAQAISVLADAKDIEKFVERSVETGEEEINVCKAWNDMKEEARLEGVNQGIAFERENSIRNFIEDNIEEGISKDKIVSKLIKRYHLNSESAEMLYSKYKG